MTWPDSSDDHLTFRQLYRRQVFAAYSESPSRDLLHMLEMLDQPGHIVFPDEVGYDEDAGPIVRDAMPSTVDDPAFFVMKANGRIALGDNATREDVAAYYMGTLTTRERRN